MKRDLLIILGITSILSAGDLEEAEKLFHRGKLQECDAVISKAFGTELPSWQKDKLRAMREYILSKDPQKIAESVKHARKISSHQGWLTADLLNHSATLINRAEYWKSRGIPEYQDLSGAAAKLLGQLKDGGNPEIAIKTVILQTKNFNLNSEFKEPISLIRDVLRMYYPQNRYGHQQKSSGEVELYVLLGEQYAGLSAASHDNREKINALSQCARHYLSAIEHLPPNSERYQDIADRLCFCQETLRLLGYSLRLPTRIRPRKSVVLSMIDEMLAQRRYQNVVIALESKSAPEMRLRYAVALSAIGQSHRAVAELKKIKKISESHWVLQAARHSLASQKTEDAAYFFKRFLELSPKSPEAWYANRQYASILLSQKKYADGATVFLKQAELAIEKQEKENALFQASRCYYQAKNYQDCVKLLHRISQRPEQTLLLAQAYIRLGNVPEAYGAINRVLAAESLPPEVQCDTIKLAIQCAMKISSGEAIKCLEQFLNLYPQDSLVHDYARHLLRLYKLTGAPEKKFEKLAEIFMNNSLSDSSTVSFVLACVDRMPNTESKERIFRRLLGRKDFSVSELNLLLKQLPTLALKQEFLKKYKKPFVNTSEVCELYFQIAEIEYASHNYHSTLFHLHCLLNQRIVFRYKDCKKLQVKVNVELGDELAVRKSCQELLLTQLNVEEKRHIALLLAKSWERSGEYKKAIVNAWTAIPLDGKYVDAKDRIIVKELLALIIRNAERIGSTSDVQEAQKLIQRNPH